MNVRFSQKYRFEYKIRTIVMQDMNKQTKKASLVRRDFYTMIHLYHMQDLNFTWTSTY